MNTSKTRPVAKAHKSPLQVETDLRNNVQVLHSELSEIDELAIDEEFDMGGDPYNSTGSHVILEQKKDDEE
jgi:hypothetical protein